MTENTIDNGPRPVPPNVAIPKYCAFIDVLGYGALIQDTSLNYSQKSHRLNSLYSNVVTNVGMDIGHLNRTYGNPIKAWSFSDCLYLQSDSIEMLVVAIERIFNNVFNLYTGFSLTEEWTPMLRCGMAKGWIHEFRSFSSLVNGGEETTPVGPGVAHAFWTSEKSGISGMKIILTNEVIQDLRTTHLGTNPFEHVIKEIASENVVLPYYFKRVTGGTKEKPVTLFELIWPFEAMGNTPWNFIDELEKLHATFDPNHLRHFTATAKLFRDALDISGQRKGNPVVYERERDRLNEMVEGRIPPPRD